MIVIIKSLLILTATTLFFIPFLPLKKADICFAKYDYDKKERHKNLPFVLVSILVSLILIVFLADINKALNWFFELSFMQKVISWLSGRFVYSVTILKYVILNILTFVPYLLLKGIIKKIADKVSPGKSDGGDTDGKTDRRPQKLPKQVKSNENRKARLEELRKNSVLCFGDPAEKGSAQKRVVVRSPKKKEEPAQKTAKKAQDIETFGDFIRLAYRKIKGVFYNEDDGFATVKYPVLKWSKHLCLFLIISGALFILLMAALMIPVFFNIKWDAAYSAGVDLAEKMYLFPMIGFIVLRELCCFISGEPKSEPEDFEVPFSVRHPEEEIDFSGLDEALISENQKSFARVFRSGSADNSNYDITKAAPAVNKIKHFIEKTRHTVNLDFLCGLDHMFAGENVIFDTTIYSSLGEYIFCYMHAELSFGKRILFICSDRSELLNAKAYLKEGLERISGDIWRIEDISNFEKGKKTDVLFLTIDELDKKSVFTSGKMFFEELTDVFIFDAERVLALHKYLCLIVTKKLEKEAGTGLEGKPPLNYRFFTSGNVANIKNTLVQLFNLGKRGLTTIETFNSAFDAKVFLWKTGMDPSLYIDRSASQMHLGTNIAHTAKRFRVEYVSLITGNTVYDSQISNYDGLLLNRCSASDNDLGYTIICDDNFNFPSTIYHYLRFTGKIETVLHIICKPYLLREYFLENAEKYTDKYDIFGKMSNERTENDKTALITLIIDAVNGIPLNEFISRVEAISEYLELKTVDEDNKDRPREYVKACLSKLLGEKFDPDALHHKLTPQIGFDGSVSFILNITDNDKLFAGYLESQSPVTVKFENTEESGIMPISKNLISRYYLPSQTITFCRNGTVRNYTVKDINIEKGILTLDDTDASVNVPEEYIQKRIYSVKSVKKLENKSVTRQFKNIGVEIDSMFLELCDAEISVDTEGFYEVSNTLKTVSFRSDTLSKYTELNANLKRQLHRDIKTNILILKLHSKNEFSADMSAALAVIIGEMMKTVFPDSYKCIAVCPVNGGKAIGNSEQTDCILDLYPTLNGLESDENVIELALIEDVDGGNGIAEGFCTSNGLGMINFIGFVSEFLHWAEDDCDRKLDYLKFGFDKLPDFIEVPALSEKLKQFRRDIVNVEYRRKEKLRRCSFCHAAKDERDLLELEDGRLICKDCRLSSVDTFEKLDDLVKKVRDTVLASTEVKDTFMNFTVDFVSTKELHKRYEGMDEIPVSYVSITDRKIFVEYGLPEAALCGAVARQMTVLWQMYNLDITDSPIYEGHCDFVELYVTDKLYYSEYFKNTAELYAENQGYITLRDALKELNSDDSFSYMLNNNTGDGTDFDTGDKFVKHRNPAGVPYFHYERLNNEEKIFYDKIVEAVRNFSTEPADCGMPFTQEQISKVFTAVCYDHPEFFWLVESYSYHIGSTSDIIPEYCMDEKEVQRRQTKIDRATDEILKCVTPGMGDYEAALTIHDKIVSLLDYDSLKLDEEKLKPKMFNRHYVDDIRSIYGALVNHKAVCTGYAQAMQYLLNKIGIECTQVVEVGSHRWNLINLESDYYYIDATWDDGSNTDFKKNRNETHHDYFCITTAELLRSRNISHQDEFNYPECTAIKCNYHVREKLYFKEYSYEKIKEAVASQIKARKKILSLKFADSRIADIAYDRLINEQEIFDILRSCDPKIKRISGTSRKNELNILRIYL